jgi:uncharacterized protein YndB with AHSA1/START domain
MSEPIHQETVFDASPTRIYEAFMDAWLHGEFTSLGPEDGGGTATINREVGGSFSCHRGRIVGIKVELVPNQRIVQAWRAANWEDGVYSIIRLELKAEGSGTLSCWTTRVSRRTSATLSNAASPSAIGSRSKNTGVVSAADSRYAAKPA